MQHNPGLRAQPPAEPACQPALRVAVVAERLDVALYAPGLDLGHRQEAVGEAYYRAPWGDFDLTGGRAARVSGVEPGELEGPATRSYQQLLDELNAATVAVNELVADLQKLREKFE